MSVESRVAKVATVTTALIVASEVGLILKERADHKRQETKDRNSQLQSARRLAEDSYNSGDSGIIFTRRIS